MRLVLAFAVVVVFWLWLGETYDSLLVRCTNWLLPGSFAIDSGASVLAGPYEGRSMIIRVSTEGRQLGFEFAAIGPAIAQIAMLSVVAATPHRSKAWLLRWVLGTSAGLLTINAIGLALLTLALAGVASGDVSSSIFVASFEVFLTMSPFVVCGLWITYFWFGEAGPEDAIRSRLSVRQHGRRRKHV